MPRAMPISVAVAFAIAGLVRSDVVVAHHSVLAFDGARGIELSGRVQQIKRINPHTEITLAVTGADGATKTWTIESESALLLSRLGWDDQVIGVGDWVTVVGAPAKDGGPALRCRHLRLEDGRSLACYPGLDGLDAE